MHSKVIKQMSEVGLDRAEYLFLFALLFTNSGFKIKMTYIINFFKYQISVDQNYQAMDGIYFMPNPLNSLENCTNCVIVNLAFLPVPRDLRL
jgi:hypothetical protein